VKFGRPEIGKVVRYLDDEKKFRFALASVWIAPKICQGQLQTMYPECSRFHSNWFTFGRVISKRV